MATPISLQSQHVYCNQRAHRYVHLHSTAGESNMCGLSAKIGHMDMQRDSQDSNVVVVQAGGNAGGVNSNSRPKKLRKGT